MTRQLLEVLVLTTLAGCAIPLGAFLATVERIQSEWLEQEVRHSIIAFGGGALLSAVSLVLVPEGIRHLSVPWVIIAFVSGGITFMLIDSLLARSHGSAAQLLAMLSDFVPEAIALGAAFAMQQSAGLLLAMLIALQNLPEGFNAYRELQAIGLASHRNLILTFFLLVPLGPIAGAIGYFWLAAFPPAVGFIMLFAASGILYLTFHDIAPQVQLENRFAPALGAVLGFLMGLVGQMLIHPS